MATIGQINTVDAISTKAKEVLRSADQMRYISGLWVNQNVNTLTDADIQNIPGMEGTSATELLAAKQAIDTLVATIGDVTTVGSVAYKLSRVVDNIP